MRIAIVGGHLAPALAVIDALPKNTQLLFIGRKYVFEGDKAFSLEYKTIIKLKIPFAEISTGRLQRIITRHTIPSLFKMPYGFFQSLSILHKFRPDVVLSLGGYLSPPVVISAWFLKIPVVIHEQTLEVGLSNEWMKHFAKKICISWESSFEYFPRSKTVLTGNPIRKFQIPNSKFQINSKFKIPNKGIPIIYVTGGSSGSHFINTLVEGCIKELLKKFIIIHQTGDAQEYHDFDRLQKLRESLPSVLQARYTIAKFVEPENVGSIINRAYLVVSRAGINTVTELLFFKKPSLLIPIPISQRDEQKKNALFLKSLGLAEVFYQDTLDSKNFLRFVEEMFNNIDRYKILKPRQTRLNQVQYDKGDAVQKIIEVIEYAAQKRKKK